MLLLVAQYWDGSYPPSPPAQPSALDGAALPGGGRGTASDMPSSDTDSDPEPEPIGDFCYELRTILLVADINKNQPEESWVALAVFMEMLLGIRENVSPDFARNPEWHEATVTPTTQAFDYINPLVAGCHPAAVTTSSRTAVGGACLARNFSIVIRTLWQSELAGSQTQPTTPTALATAATSVIGNLANTGEALLAMTLSSAVNIAGTVANNKQAMETWWLGPFVFEVPTVTTTQILSRSLVVTSRPPPPPPPSSVDSGSSGLNDWQIGMIAAGSAIVLGYYLYKRRKKCVGTTTEKRVPVMIAGATGGLFLPGMYYKRGCDHILQDVVETTPLRFELGNVLTR